MLVDVTDVRWLGDHRLWLRFADGAEGVVDFLEHFDFRGIFGALQDPAVFGAVRVDREVGTIVWPNGADLDPDVLYAYATGAPLPAWASPSDPGTAAA